MRTRKQKDTVIFYIFFLVTKQKLLFLLSIVLQRFYPLFAVVGNLAPIVSGKVMSAIVAVQQSSDDVSFGQTLKFLVRYLQGA